MTELPRCLGVRVVYDAKLRSISNSRGIGRWNKIVVGPAFFRFPPREQQAILLHEVAHCKMKHLEQRLRSMWLVLWNWNRLAGLCVEQEHAADRFVSNCGYGADLARAFQRLKPKRSILHPPIADRISRLTL